MILFTQNVFEYKVRKRENLNFKVPEKSCEVLNDQFSPKIGIYSKTCLKRPLKNRKKQKS